MKTEQQIESGGAFLLGETDPRAVFTPEDLSSEDRLIGKTAEDFMRSSVLSRIDAIEQGDHALMHDLMRQAGEIGLLGADVPEIYGGLSLPLTTTALIAEKLNLQQSFALTHEAHTVIATLPLMFFGNHTQKLRFLPKLASGEWIGCFALSEANSGSDALALQTRAVLSEDKTHYVLNGEKMWITNSAFASLFTVFAKVDGDKVTAFLVESQLVGVSLGKEEHKLGMHGTSTRRVMLENVRVPVENALEVGKGQYAAFCALNLGRFKLEAGAVGGLKETLRVCTTYASQRKAFGHMLAHFGLIQHKLAEMCARTFALESMIYRLAAAMEAEFAGIVPESPEASECYHRAAEEYSIECNIVKVIGSETYSRMTDEAIQIHGGYGYTEEFPVARAWRDQRLLRIGEGANEIVRLAIVNGLLRRDKQGRLYLHDAGERASQLLSQMEVPEPPFHEGPLEAISAAAKDLKTLSLFLLYQATERLRNGLSEAQEIVAAIADIVCATYAVESVQLRCSKLRNESSSRFAIALLAGEAAARDYAEEALNAARYALNSLPAFDDEVGLRDEPFTGLSNLLDRLGRWEGSPMKLRRELASQIIQNEGYPLTA